MSKDYLALKGVAAVLLLIVVGGIVYFYGLHPRVSPPKKLSLAGGEEMYDRGKYLVNHVTMCMDCHADKQQEYFSGPIVKGTEGKGGQQIPGVPGEVYASNITRYGLQGWRDENVLHAITVGVDKEGGPLAPMMPYSEYRYLATEDAMAIVFYTRGLKAIANDVPESSIDFPLNLIFRTLPQDAEPQRLPKPSDKVATGKYLARIAGCMFCHTPMEQGVPVAGKSLAGGHEFPLPGMGVVRSSNITPDEKTGIGSWSQKAFVERFKTYADSAGQHIPVSEVGFQTVMPWTLLAGMRDRDLQAIYSYLQTVAPIENSVERFTPAQ
jgi:hypothetical protein